MNDKEILIEEQIAEFSDDLQEQDRLAFQSGYPCGMREFLLDLQVEYSATYGDIKNEK